MFKRLILLITIAVVLLSLTSVYAGDNPKPPPVPTNGYINDGRLNGADIAAPVAVFYKYDTVRKPGDWKYPFYEVKVLRGVEILTVDPKTNTGKLALAVSAADIAKIVDAAGNKEGTLIVSKNGYSMYYSSANWFWITAPDANGKTYTFQWQNLTVPHD
ncbi:MAG: hypothetical protein GC179_28435 [Anaerolineaceae bacterium]|nr:hypothetical protein [Anaerolineaceae bacterium]